MRRLLYRLLASRLAREQRGAALMMLLAFMVLAVPLTIAALQVASQLSRSSFVYDRRLTSMYSAGAGVEYALWQVLNDPTFDDGLTPDNPTTEVTVEANNQTITVSVTKIFSEATLEGQGIVISKEVSPTSATPLQSTTFTYTVRIKNEGTGTVQLKQVYDYLPPGFSYATGSTSGITTQDPSVSPNGPVTCGGVPQELYWNVQPLGINVAAGQEVTLSFRATATPADNTTYYNQASVRYDPWWSSPDVYVYSAYTAVITVGDGSQKCGYNLQVFADKTVVPAVPPPGVETDFTYTITVENISPDPVYICKIDDLLPPTFSYITASAGQYGSNISTSEPQQTWQSGPQRWLLEWFNGSASSPFPLITISPGESKTQVFRARATPESGVNYFNEFNVTWAKELVGGKCQWGQSGGTAQGGAGQGAQVDAPTMYDVASVAPDGSVQARLVFYEAAGQIEIISWQEY